MSKNGFFSKILFDSFKKDEVTEASWYSLSEDVEKLCHTVIFSLKIDSDNLQQILVASLYLKILATYQAILVLLEKEILNESKILLRSMLESVFALVAIANDEKIASRFIENDYIQRLKLVSTYNSLPEKLKRLIKPQVNKILKSRLEGIVKPTVKTLDISPLTVKQLAVVAELEDFYYSAFALLSGSSYLRVYELEQYWKKDTSNENFKLLINPNAKKSDPILFTTLKSMFISLNNVMAMFNIKTPREYIQLVESFQSLVSSSAENPAQKRVANSLKTAARV